jgi:V8-like Glu-specific endopeptidase
VLASVLAVTASIVVAASSDAASGSLDQSRSGKLFPGRAAVGALFTTHRGRLAWHFCTASVVHSPGGDLLITAAHCLSGHKLPIDFAPGYSRGKAPFGTWRVTRIFRDRAWTATHDADDDVAFLSVRRGRGAARLESVTGAERLGTGWPARELVQVIGYPNAASRPVICQNWTTRFGARGMRFDCGGYPDGTSGGPFLAHVSRSTGRGSVIGVIGGYERGGDSPEVSYSTTFGSSVRDLYRQATDDSYVGLGGTRLPRSPGRRGARARLRAYLSRGAAPQTGTYRS